MKLLTFKTLYIEGFQSIIEPLEYALDTPGLNILNGKNGSGKTSIISAIPWCIYGKTLKKKNNPTPYKHIQPKKFKGTLVKLLLEKNGIEYLLCRSRGYKDDFGAGANSTGVFLFKKGVLQTANQRDIGDSKELIQNLIEASYPLLTNSIIFGQKLKRIIQEEGGKRNEILEEAFDVMFIKKGREISGEKLKNLQNDADGIQGGLKLLSQAISLRKESYKQLRQDKKSIRIKIESIKKEALSTRVEATRLLRLEQFECRKEIVGIDKALEALRAHEKNRNEIINRLQVIEFDILNLDARVKKLIKSIQSRPASSELKCPTCNQTLKGSSGYVKRTLANAWAKKKLKVGEVIDGINEKLHTLKTERTLAKRRISSLETYREQIQTNKKRRNKLEALIEKATVNLRNLRNRRRITGMQELRELRDKTQASLIDVKKHLDLKKSERRGLKEDLKVLLPQVDAYEWVHNQALGNAGLKAYIFSQMVKKLNRRLTYYAEYIGFQVIFSVKLDSKRKDFITKIYKGEHERDYHELSGGQQQLVDVAIAFSFHDLKSATIDCNILIMDEIFESLDEENVEVIMELIKLKSKGKSLHLITHLSEFNSASASVVKVKLNRKEQTHISL